MNHIDIAKLETLKNTDRFKFETFVFNYGVDVQRELESMGYHFFGLKGTPKIIHLTVSSSTDHIARQLIRETREPLNKIFIRSELERTEKEFEPHREHYRDLREWIVLTGQVDEFTNLTVPYDIFKEWNYNPSKDVMFRITADGKYFDF